MIKFTVIPNIKKDTDLSVTKNVVSYLTNNGALVTLPLDFQCFSFSDVLFKDNTSLFVDSDFCITIGGDGTILKIADVLSQKGIPVIGINLGRLGFMTEIEPNEIDVINDIFEGNFDLDNRMMINVSVIRENNEICSYVALNDIVVSNGSIAKMSELELYCDDTFVSLFHSDGLIVSTPTGSTAYSLSAGGAIIDPSINCLLFTPVCPHSFCNSRPIIFSHKSVLKIKNINQNDDNTYLTIDGKLNVKIDAFDVVKVQASKKTLKLIKIKSNKFYDRVYQKLSERK